MWERCTRYRTGAVLGMAFNALNLAADLFILLLPIPVVMRMQTNSWKKREFPEILSLPTPDRTKSPITKV